MEAQELKVGDVVQLGPETANKAFAFCFLTVTERKEWGVQGYVQSLGTREEIGGQAYYRALWKDMDYVGRATFVSAPPDTLTEGDWVKAVED